MSEPRRIFCRRQLSRRRSTHADVEYVGLRCREALEDRPHRLEDIAGDEGQLHYVECAHRSAVNRDLRRELLSRTWRAHLGHLWKADLRRAEERRVRTELDPQSNSSDQPGDLQMYGHLDVSELPRAEVEAEKKHDLDGLDLLASLAVVEERRLDVDILALALGKQLRR